MAGYSYPRDSLTASENARVVSMVLADVQSTLQITAEPTPTARGASSAVSSFIVSDDVHPWYTAEGVSSGTIHEVLSKRFELFADTRLYAFGGGVGALGAPAIVDARSRLFAYAQGVPVINITVVSSGEVASSNNLRYKYNFGDRLELRQEEQLSCYSEHNVEEHIKAYIGWTTAWWAVLTSTGTVDEECSVRPYQLLVSRVWGWVGGRLFNVIREQATDVGRFSGTAIRCRDEIAVSTAVMDSVGIRGVRLFPTTISKGYARSTATNTNKTNAVFMSWLDARSSVSASLYERVVDSLSMTSTPNTAAYVLLVSNASADSDARPWQLPAPLTSRGTLHPTCALGVSTTSSSAGSVSGEWTSHVRSHVNFIERMKEASIADMYGRILATYVDRLRATPIMDMRLTADTTDSLQVQGGEASGVYNILISNMTSSTVATATSVGRGDIIARARLTDAVKTALAELATSSGTLSTHSWGDASLAVTDALVLGSILYASTTTLDNVEDRLRCSATAGHYTAVVVSSRAQFSDYRHVMVEV